MPIPGTKRRTYLDQNVAALAVELTDSDLSELDSLSGTVAGDRYAGNTGVEGVSAPRRDGAK